VHLNGCYELGADCSRRERLDHARGAGRLAEAEVVCLRAFRVEALLLRNDVAAASRRSLKPVGQSSRRITLSATRSSSKPIPS
jgi:hypothetical protein